MNQLQTSLPKSKTDLYQADIGEKIKEIMISMESLFTTIFVTKSTLNTRHGSLLIAVRGTKNMVVFRMSSSESTKQAA